MKLLQSFSGFSVSSDQVFNVFKRISGQVAVKCMVSTEPVGHAQQASMATERNQIHSDFVGCARNSFILSPSGQRFTWNFMSLELHVNPKKVCTRIGLSHSAQNQYYKKLLFILLCKQQTFRHHVKL